MSALQQVAFTCTCGALVDGSGPHAPTCALRDFQVLLPYREAKRRVVEAFCRDYFEKLFAVSGNSPSKAAKIAGLDRSNLKRLVRTWVHPDARPPQAKSRPGPGKMTIDRALRVWATEADVPLHELRKQLRLGWSGLHWRTAVALAQLGPQHRRLLVYRFQLPGFLADVELATTTP